MENERDIVEFQDEAGNVIAMEVYDYFFYEGEEFALLAEYDEEDDACAACESQDCAGCTTQKDVYVMKVVPVGEDEEEFVEVDEELAQTLIDLYQNGFGEDDEEFDEE